MWLTLHAVQPTVCTVLPIKIIEESLQIHLSFVSQSQMCTLASWPMRLHNFCKVVYFRHLRCDNALHHFGLLVAKKKIWVAHTQAVLRTFSFILCLDYVKIHCQIILKDSRTGVGEYFKWYCGRNQMILSHVDILQEFDRF